MLWVTSTCFIHQEKRCLSINNWKSRFDGSKSTKFWHIWPWKCGLENEQAEKNLCNWNSTFPLGVMRKLHKFRCYFGNPFRIELRKRRGIKFLRVKNLVNSIKKMKFNISKILRSSRLHCNFIFVLTFEKTLQSFQDFWSNLTLRKLHGATTKSNNFYKLHMKRMVHEFKWAIVKAKMCWHLR